MENGMHKNYLKQTGAGKERTLRIEVVGDVTPEEMHFLTGMLHITAGTIRKDAKFVRHVSAEMTKLVKNLVVELKKEMGK